MQVFTKNINVCNMEAVLHDTKSEFRFLIAFILAGFVATSVSIWRLRRQNYAALCGNTRNLTVLMMSMIDGDDDQLTAVRETLARWTILAFELAVLKARGHIDSEQGE